MYLLSVFGGALFILPILTLIGAVIFGYQAYKAHNSNSTQQVDGGSSNVHIEDNTGNVPYTQIGQFWFSMALAAATIIIVLVMISDK